MDEEVVAAVLPKAGETVWDSVQRITEASICMNDNHSRFETKMKTLCAVRDDLKERTTKYKSTKNRTMEDWFHRVMAVEKIVEELESKFIEKQETSTWIHVLPRSKLSKQMASMCLEISELVVEGNQLADTLVHKVPDRVVKMAAPDISYIPTLQGVLDKILQHLSNDEDVKAIRVLGMLGTGKTTILQNLNNHETVRSMYERVIWVTVSGEENNKENLSIEMLQNVIAERLLVADTESSKDVYNVARRINKELVDVKYLLLLDDVKEELDLEAIGVPEGAKGSKVVMTTKYRHVRLPSCSNVEVKKLSQSESWNMFHRLLSFPNDVKNKPQLERMAHKAVSLCGGHPLMIKMAARIFKSIENHELNEISWSDALQTLRRWPEKGKDSDPMKHLLKFCCDHLDHEHKPCFLYSALYPEDTEICTEGLMECWHAENFVKSHHDAKVGARSILRHLQNVILLEEDATGRHVRMHKLIRAAALNLLSEDKYVVKTSESVQIRLNDGVTPKRQCVDLWRDKEWISLANNSLVSLPDAPCSSHLSTLFLQKYSKHKTIPDSFFRHMPKLLVLDLYMTEIMSLPSSVYTLSNLKVLYLNRCTILKELHGFIGQLKSLEVLDIRGCGVDKLPHQILGLTRMRRLLVSFSMSTQDNYDAIFKLSGLEELIIDVDSEMEDWCSTLIEDVVEKVSTLPNLTSFQICLKNEVIDVIQFVDDTLKIYLPRERHLISFLKRRKDFKATCFQVYIGCFMSCVPEIPEFYRFDKYLKYHSGMGESDDVNIVLSKVHALEMINHNDIEYLSSNVIESMNDVQGCLIQSCNDMRTLVEVCHTTNKPLLPNLERLDVRNMPRLEILWAGHAYSGSLSKLKTLVICRCPRMTKVFCNAVVQQLRELEYLEVKDCCKVEEIVTCSQVVSSYVAPKLRTLVLCKLASLRKISSTRLGWNSLERLKIQDCPTMNELPLDGTSAVELKRIEVDEDWWEALQWSDYKVKDRLVRCCHFR